MTKEEIQALPDGELYRLSLQKGKTGNYSQEATLAYMERQRRAGFVHIEGAAKTCRPLRNDIDYFGGANISNR